MHGGGDAPSGGSLGPDGGFVQGVTLSGQLFFLVTHGVTHLHNPEFFFFSWKISHFSETNED